MSYFTITNLREVVAEYNSSLLEHGVGLQFFIHGRNGYQAVDEYQTDSKGKWISTVCENVGCGTSREVAGYCKERFNHILNTIK